ncbi:MAG TPA: cell division FtsA domain-containing protein [Eubacteriales bacterium]|nr:cell division FtsA domain-containing protein [Eubacteriales bacterium]
MKRKDVAILDFGSSKIICAVGCMTSDGFAVKALGQCSYDGFYQGEWLAPEKISDSVATAIKQAEKTYGKAIKDLFIGVPGEFTRVSTGQYELNFKSKKKINNDDIAEIYARACPNEQLAALTPISQSVIHYIIDDDRQTVDPLGCQATKLFGLISYIYASEYFIDCVTPIVNALGITQTILVSSCLAEALFLISPETRDKQAILIDVGYITTNVMLVGGDGLLFMKSFSVGGGHISADLCKVLEISYKSAEQLRQKINLNLEFKPVENYILSDGTEIKAEQSNEIAKARIEEIGEYIIKCFDSYSEEIPLYTPVYLTGGGLTYLKGGAEFLSRVLRKKVETAKTLDPLKNKPEFASVYGLVELAVKQRANKRLF